MKNILFEYPSAGEMDRITVELLTEIILSFVLEGSRLSAVGRLLPFISNDPDFMRTLCYLKVLELRWEIYIFVICCFFGPFY